MGSEAIPPPQVHDLENNPPPARDIEDHTSGSEAQGSPGTNVVDWDGPDDPKNPQNWSVLKKTWLSVLVALCTFTVAFGSSILSSATEELAQLYHVSPTVIILSLTVYVLGFAAGPWVWGPASECVYPGCWPT